MKQVHVNIIRDMDALNQMVEAYLTHDAFVLDVETSTRPHDHGLNPILNKVLWLGFATYGRVDVIPIGHPNGEYIRTEYPLLAIGEKRVAEGKEPLASHYSRDEKKANKIFTSPPKQLLPGEVFKALEPLLFAEDIRKIGHNFKFDMKSIAKYLQGRIIPGPYGDTKEMSSIVDSRNVNSRDLKSLLAKYLDYEMAKGTGSMISQSTFDEVAEYLYRDCRYTWLLFHEFSAAIDNLGMRKVFNLEMDILGVTADMEIEGAPYDFESAKQLASDLDAQAEDIKGQIYSAAGRAFNLSSTKDKQILLYSPKAEGGRGLKPKKFTPGGVKKIKAGQDLDIFDYSTDAEALEKLAGRDPIVDLMLEYQSIHTLMKTFVIPYVGGNVTRTTSGKEKTTYRESLLIKGRVHTNFNSQGAETGRFSSSDPNLQNIPSRGPNAKKVRALFLPPDDDHVLVVADYSQIEPRIIASFSGDPLLVENYNSNGDIYTTVGSALGVDRPAGKELVLSISYGVGPEKVAVRMRRPINEVKKLMDDFNNRFKSIDRYRQKVVKESRSRHPVPYVTTMLGRRRYLPLLMATDSGTRGRGERQAFNTKIQGSAADIIKVAMVRAHRLIPEQSRMILTVHDEIVTIAPKNLAEETAEAIRSAMEGINVLKVPLVADVKIVNNWGEAK
jgi:DNA polymerase I-like protein with 3'-5' exonuclease and polymerase domains